MADYSEFCVGVFQYQELAGVIPTQAMDQDLYRQSLQLLRGDQDTPLEKRFLASTPETEPISV